MRLKEQENRTIKGNSRPNFAGKTLKVLFGLFVCAVGVIMTVNAGIGVSPWVVFFQGVANVSPLSIGGASILSGFLILLTLIYWKEYPGFGTIYDMIATGIFMDILIAVDIIPKANGLISGILFVIAGLFVVALGCYIYMKQGIGAGPKDFLMVALAKRNRFSPGANRAFLESSACFLGWLMGGEVGIGTVIAAFGLGSAMQILFWALKFDAKSIKQESVIDTWAIWKEKSAE